MKLRAIFPAAIVVFALTLCCTLPAFAATARLVPSGDRGYVLQGTDLDNIAGIDVTITYDTATLSNPEVTAGGLVAGAMFVPNKTIPGVIRIGIVTTRAIKGAGIIANVTFAKKIGAVGKITDLKVSFVDANLAPSPVIAQIDNPVDAGGGGDVGDTGTGGGTGGTGGGTGGGGTIVVGGTVTLPGDTPAVAEKKAQPPVPEYKEESRTEAAVIAREATPASEVKPQEAEAKSQVKQPELRLSVLERMRKYKGELTVKSLLAFFDQDEKSGYRQDPPILLADGKAVLKMTIPKTGGDKAPNFALRGARLVSLKKNQDNDWVVEARPDKGVSVASITMLLEESMVDIPLTVAPKIDLDLDKSGKVTEDDFQLFLKDRGTEKAPKYDLNGDGRRDYLDDYIYAANYQAALMKKPKEKAPDLKAKEKPSAGKAIEKPAAIKVKE